MFKKNLPLEDCTLPRICGKYVLKNAFVLSKSLLAISMRGPVKELNAVNGRPV